jgi:hypothetical protein
MGPTKKNPTRTGFHVISWAPTKKSKHITFLVLQTRLLRIWYCTGTHCPTDLTCHLYPPFFLLKNTEKRSNLKPLGLTCHLYPPSSSPKNSENKILSQKNTTRPDEGESWHSQNLLVKHTKLFKRWGRIQGMYKLSLIS